MSVDRATVEFYDRNAADYARYSDVPDQHPNLLDFMAGLPRGARVLDFGCGTGWAAAALIAEGHRADGIDASTGLAEEGARRHGLDIRVAGFTALAARQRYDGIWSHFSLQHAPRDERAMIFERMQAALRPGGLIYIGVQKGPMDWRDDHGRLYCPFMQHEMETLMNGAGFQDITYDHGTGKMYDGSSALNLHVRARA